MPWLEVALSRSPSDKRWVSLEVHSSAPGRPWDDCSPGWHLDCNIMTDWAKKPHWIPELWNLQDTNVYIVFVQLLSGVRLFVTPLTAARQAPLSTVSWSLLKFMSVESVMLSNHLVLCCHRLLLLPSVFLSLRVFSNELAICIRWPKYRSFSISISRSNEYSGLISSRIHWFDVLALQGTLKNLL